MHTISTPNAASHQLPLAELAAAIEAMIALYDAALPDPDLELNGDENDSDGDERGDTAWIEWSNMPGSQKSGHNLLAGEEDAEDDEGGGDHGGDEGEPDFAKRAGGYGAGCNISDPDFEHDGCEEEGR